MATSVSLAAHRRANLVPCGTDYLLTETSESPKLTTTAAQNEPMAGNRVALVLGSGGARGYAHIGVITELRERGYEIVGIAGSSMGALVGGLQAAGKLDEFAGWAMSLTQRAVLRLLDPSITAAGVLRAVRQDPCQ